MRKGGVGSCAGLWLMASIGSAEEGFQVRLPTELSSPRAVGLSGSLVGLGGDVSAAAANPASLVAVPRTLDVTLAGGNKGGYALGGAFHPFRFWAFGLFLPSTDIRRDLVASTPQGAGSGAFRPSDGRYVGVAAAYKPDRRIAFGSSLRLEHQRIRDARTESARQSWINWSVGVFIQPDDADGARFGLAYRRGTDRSFEMGVHEIVHVRRPDTLSAGVSWQYGWLRNARIVTTLQPELVHYARVSGSTDGGASLARAGVNELDLRAGFEASFPFGPCVTGCGGLFQVRLGLLTRASLPRGATDIADPGGRTASWAGGLSLAPPWKGGKFRLDAAYSRETRVVMVGLAWRFPEAFRGDLQHHRSRSLP